MLWAKPVILLTSYCTRLRSRKEQMFDWTARYTYVRITLLLIMSPTIHTTYATGTACDSLSQTIPGISKTLARVARLNSRQESKSNKGNILRVTGRVDE